MAAPSGPGYASRASYIPLRLDPTERSLLRVLEGATHQLARSPPPRAASLWLPAAAAAAREIASFRCRAYPWCRCALCERVH